MEFKTADEEKGIKIRKSLQEDIYCATFVNFLEYYDPDIQKELMIKSVFTFGLQFVLVIIIYVWDDDAFTRPFVGFPVLNIARLICAIILHINVQPELEVALLLMRFTKDNRRVFLGSKGNRTFPFLIASFKFYGGLLTEILNIVKILNS